MRVRPGYLPDLQKYLTLIAEVMANQTPRTVRVASPFGGESSIEVTLLFGPGQYQEFLFLYSRLILEIPTQEPLA